jgi:hypothetical protein
MNKLVVDELQLNPNSIDIKLQLENISGLLVANLVDN